MPRGSSSRPTKRGRTTHTEYEPKYNNYALTCTHADHKVPIIMADNILESEVGWKQRVLLPGKQEQVVEALVDKIGEEIEMEVKLVKGCIPVSLNQDTECYYNDKPVSPDKFIRLVRHEMRERSKDETPMAVRLREVAGYCKTFMSKLENECVAFTAKLISAKAVPLDSMPLFDDLKGEDSNAVKPTSTEEYEW